MKNLKKITAFFAALFALTLGAGIFAACNGNKQPTTKETYYNVTVVMDNSPVVGATVVFEDTESDAAPQEYTTDAEGVAHVDLPRGNYHVAVTNGIPDGYEMESLTGYYTANEGRTFTIALVPHREEEGVPYTVRVIAPEGSNASLARDILYSATKNGAQMRLGKTDANGVATLNVPQSGYLFLTAPSGFNYDQSLNNEINSKGGEITFTLLRETTLRFENEMDDAEKQSFSRLLGGSIFSDNALGDNGRTGYIYTATLAKGETQFFTMRAAESDYYTLFANKPTDVELRTLGNSHNIKEGELFTSTKAVGASLQCTKNSEYTFTLTAGNAATTLQFVILLPAEKNETRIETTGTFDLAIQEHLPALISFRPAVQGKYQLRIETEGNFIIHNIYDRYAISPSNPTQGSTDNSAISYNKIYEVDIYDENLYYKNNDGTINKNSPTTAEWLFRIFTNDSVSYPLDIQVTIERIGEPDQGRLINVVSAPEPAAGVLQQATKPDGTARAIGIYKTASRIVKGTDGLYHLNAQSGPVVYVKLTGPIAPYYSNASFSELDSAGVSPYRFNVTTEEEMQDPNAPYRLLDYTRLLRGSVTEGDADAFEEYYLKYLNADGMYPLDDTLTEFLKLFSASVESWLGLFGSYSNDSLYLFSAFYYDDGTPLPAPLPSAGDGTQNTPYEVEVGSYTVEATANAPLWFVFTEEGTVNVIVDGATVSLVTVTQGQKFSVTAAASGSLIVTVNYVPGTNKLNPIEISDGQTLNNIGTDGVWYLFTATQNGIYDISFTSSAVNVYGEDGMIANLTGLLLKAGRTTIFRLTAEEGTASTTVRVEQNAITVVVPQSGDGSSATPYAIAQANELGLYGAEYSGTSIYYEIGMQGHFTISSEDDKIRIVLNGEVYERNVYVSVEVTDAPVRFYVSSLGGNEVLYFSVETKRGYDEENAILVEMSASAAAVTGHVTIEGVYNDQQLTTVGDTIYYRFIAPKEGLYILNFSDANAMLSMSQEVTANTRFVFDYGTNIYRILLAEGEEFAFMLSATGSSFPISYGFTFTWNVMPAEGSKDAPEEVTPGYHDLTLQKGEEYYYVINNDSYTVVFGAGDFIVYNLGASSFNDDRRKEDEYIVKSNDVIACQQHVPKMFLVVVATEDCTLRITFA